MNHDKLDREFQGSPEERELLSRMQGARASSSQVHDHRVLAAAREASAEMSKRGNRRADNAWRMPLSLAASFMLGLGVMFLSQALLERDDALSIPADFTRSAEVGAADIPVEDADADRWREYIEELVYNGEYRQAEAHLERFNELHPDYSSD